MKKSALLRKLPLLIVVIVIVLLFAKLTIPISFEQQLQGNVYGASLPIENPDNFVVILRLADSTSDYISIELLSVLLPSSDQINNKSTCLKKLFIENIQGSQSATDGKIWDFRVSRPSIHSLPWYLNLYFVDPYEFSFNNLCVEYYPQAINGYELYSFVAQPENLQINIMPNIELPAYYFPLDRQSIDLRIWAQTNDGYFEPDVVTIISSANWDDQLFVDTKTSSFHVFDDNEEVYEYIGEIDYTKIHINLWRPTATRVLAFTLLSILFTIILASTFIKDSGDYYGVFLGVLLGLGGLLPILKPNNSPDKTMIDAIFLSFYVLLSLTLFARLFVFPFWISENQKQNNVRPKKTRKKNVNL